MTGVAIYDALSAWRMAERKWEAADPGDPDHRAVAANVVRAWLGYHEAELEVPGRFIMIVDDQHRYVSVSRNVTDVLGYAPEELVGQRIEDLVSVDRLANTTSLWQRFLEEGRQEGEYYIQDRDGHDVHVRYRARAHHPIPGYHLSRLWASE